MSGLWPDIDIDGEFSDDGSNDEGIKNQKNQDYQEQEELVLVPRRKPLRIKCGYQRELIQLKSNIEISKDKFFFIKNIFAGSNQTKWYLVQVDMHHLEPFSMRNYGVYC